MKCLRKIAWSLLVVALLLLILRAFFFGVYQVDSPSMEPTLHGAESGGDWVVVAYGRVEDLERYDLVVLVPEGETEPFVKRVAGLPGESVVLRGGDLWIDGRIDRPRGPMPVPILVFDDELHDLETAFRVQDNWSRTDDGWHLDASSVPIGADAGLMYMRQTLEDHYLSPGGRLVQGRDAVADALLECSVLVESPGILLRLGLREKGDRFEARIATDAAPWAHMSIERLNANGRETLAETRAPFALGGHDLRFSNVNDSLTLSVDGEEILTATYEGNTAWPGELARPGVSPSWDRVFLGGVAGDATFSGIRVFRDLHYTPRGEHATQEPLQLGPDEIFVLGDNSRDSRDGRDWGATPLSDVIGRPVGVAWPPGRLHRFSPATGDWDAGTDEQDP
jgi:signal peptidase I